MKNIVAVAVLVGGLVLASKGYGVVMVIALGVALVISAGGKVMTGHSHAGPVSKIARHEAGHAAVARHVGGKVRSATVARDGSSGLTRVTLPSHDPKLAVAFWLGGQYAEGSREGASEDERLIRKELRSVPSADRSRVRREAERLARAALSARSGDVSRDAARLAERGRL